MPGFKAAFMNELVKLLKKKKLLISVVLSVIAVLIGQLAVTAVQSGFGLRIAGSTEFPLIVLPVFMYTILPMFATFVVIDMFNGEFTSNTMKLTLTRPVSRFGVYTAKVANVALFIMSNLMFVMILSLVVGLIFNPASTGFIGVLRVIIAYVTTFFPVFVFSLLVVLISNMLRSGLAVFFLSILVFIGFIVMSFLFSHYSGIFITSLFDWYSRWISESMNVFKLMRQALMLLGYAIMLFSAGYYLFDRKDL